MRISRESEVWIWDMDVEGFKISVYFMFVISKQLCLYRRYIG
jgi:hypothetical protein